MLEASGTPAMVTRAKIAPPALRVGPITDAELAEVQASSPFKGKYDVAIDREFAFEILQAKAQGRTSGPPVRSNEEQGGLLSQIGASLQDLFLLQWQAPVHRAIGDALGRDLRRPKRRLGHRQGNSARGHRRDEVRRADRISPQ